MTINKWWEKYLKGGYVMLSYPLMFAFLNDLKSPLILCQLIGDFKYAVDNKLNVGKYFLVNIRRLSDYLGLRFSEIEEAINKLILYRFIGFLDNVGIDDTYIMWINEDEVIDELQCCEEEKVIHRWHHELSYTQNPDLKRTSFNRSTNALIKFVNNNMKKPQKIPMVVYAGCNSFIEKYEIDGKKILDNTDNKMQILKCINAENFESVHLLELIFKICTEVQK